VDIKNNKKNLYVFKERTAGSYDNFCSRHFNWLYMNDSAISTGDCHINRLLYAIFLQKKSGEIICAKFKK
jgi:hypothetical protein